MRRTLFLSMLAMSPVLAQNEWTLQPWVQVYGTVSGTRMGYDVSGLGRVIGDTTRIGVSTFDETRIFSMRSQQDTVPRIFFPGRPVVLGDLDGDGTNDLVVGGNPTRVYLGNSEGSFDTNASFTKYGEQDAYAFGTRIATGDINGDMYDDLIISDAGYPSMQMVGRVYAFLGGSTLDTLVDVTLTGDSAYFYLGWAVASGDLNNDGYDEIIVRGYDSNHPTETEKFGYLNVYAGATLLDTVAWKYLKGGSITTSGLSTFDVNGDGIDDLLWTNRDSLDWVYVHFGGAQFDTIPSLRLKDPQAAVFGNVVANGGDMNGDGYDDIVVGSYAGITSGFVFVYSGGPLIDPYFDAAVGQSTDSKFGWSVAGIGDVNGDGLSDIIVGAPEYDFGTNKGYWGIFLGDTNIPVTSVEAPEEPQSPLAFSLLSNYPNPFNSQTTIVYRIKSASVVRLVITNLLGQELVSLIEEKQQPGEYSVPFKPEKYPSGVYLYKLTAVDQTGVSRTETKRMTLIK